MDRQIVTYDKKGFIINGKREFLIGGEFHYFRVPAGLWEDRLGKMKNTGANLISVYIPWNMHEPEEGKERWTGDYDLGRFLDLCQKYGFYILVKPGPYICAELDFGGHPDWLIAKAAAKEIKLRRLEEGYLALCRRWYKRVGEMIRPYLAVNGGKVIAVQIENEYDHLIEYGDEPISREEAVEYFLCLKKIMEECGIHAPKFANEAAFLRGKGVIDTRTYYPNIPGLWMWEFDLFDGKIREAVKEQPDCPVMILELQAGWFAQIGAPIYEPPLEVVEGVSKSVLMQGASVMNYYMMVGGTTFPFTGARGDIYFLGGLGNITSYDFGASPVREDGEIHPEKYYWIKGFIRFVREFADLILNDDGKNYVKVTGGGEDIALLTRKGAAPDTDLSRSNENFRTFERGNEKGRFFCVRNLEEEKTVTINIDRSLMGKEHVFRARLQGKETRLFPVNFKIPGSNLTLNYATSEVLFSRQYEKGVAFVLYGKKGAEGEISLRSDARIDLLQSGAEVSVVRDNGEILLKYRHTGIGIVKINNVYFFLIAQELVGRVEELSTGLLFHNLYYVEEIREIAGVVKLKAQVREMSDNFLQFFPLTNGTAPGLITVNGREIKMERENNTGMYQAAFTQELFDGRPEVSWLSDWKYGTDSEEVAPGYDHSQWLKTTRPATLEELGLIEHGYYWFRTCFELAGSPGRVLMDYEHNDTDRMFIYLNGELVYKSHNRKIKQMEVSRALKEGENVMTVLYANEFHNKSHPHEGELIKYSGLMNPFRLYGQYEDGREIDLTLESFYIKKGLSGLDKGFHRLDYDDSSWPTVPGGIRKLVAAPELGHIIWLRRKFRYDPGKGFSAPLKLWITEADQKLTMYVNGRPVGRYDALGPQKEFYIPETFLNPCGENLLALILEAPAFYDELQSGYRRGYLVAPELKPAFIAKSTEIEIK